MNLGHWSTSITIPDEPYGFIYCITNTTLNKIYIGKKQMLCTKKLKPLKGKTKKRHVVIETDWKDYTSSSNELNADIVKYGKANFIFEIIRFCCSKSELAYFEAKEQFNRDVLITEGYYNGIINCRIGKIKLSLK
jgi:hypothetical protein